VIPGESKASFDWWGRRLEAGVVGGGSRRLAEPRNVEFEYGKDWSVAGGGTWCRARSMRFEGSGNLAFCWETGTLSTRQKPIRFAGIDVKGKIVVVAGAARGACGLRLLRGGRGGWARRSKSSWRGFARIS